MLAKYRAAGLGSALVLVLLVAGCAGQAVQWAKPEASESQGETAIAACRQVADADYAQAVRSGAAFRGPRYNIRREGGLFGPGARYDSSPVRRLVVGEIALNLRHRYRLAFEACMTDKGYAPVAVETG